MTAAADLHQSMRAIAERQHGVVGRSQALEIGASSQFLHRLRSSLEWEPVTSRVLRLRGSMPSYGQRLMGAVLDVGPDAFVSGTAAAAWWQIPGFSRNERWRVHVTRPRGRTRRPSELATVHEVLALRTDHAMWMGGVPVSVPSRTIFELAAAVSPKKAARACDSALAMRLTTVRLLNQMLQEWAQRGRPGTCVMREILDERQGDYVPPASNLERRFADLVTEAGLGPYRRQVDLGGTDWVGRVDFVHADLPVVVEVLSDRYHSSRLDREADARRFAELSQAGFAVVQVWDVEIWHAPGQVLERLRRTERVALANRRTMRSHPR